MSPERAKTVVGQLMSDALFSGWGVRTLSTDDAGSTRSATTAGPCGPTTIRSSPSAWRGTGSATRRTASRWRLLQAASFSRHRLPEAFSGYPRSVGRFPVPYPTACSPQAWATGAPLLLVRAMLGLEMRDGKLTVDPDLPDEIGSITITGVPAVGHLWDVHAEGRTGRVEAHVSA